MILLWLTLAAVAILILALVVYLLAIIYYLRKADRHLAELVEELQTTERQVTSLPEQLPAVNSALRTLLTNLISARGHLAPIDQLVSRRQEG
jgi:uncharacterized protein YoxC